MKDNYNRSVSLRCITCVGTAFNFNEDKSYIQCEDCKREYSGGYDELVELNQQNINEEVEQLKKEVTEDIKSDFANMFRSIGR